jgi:anion-transporting  ArsA/GET3 family ATPase
MTESPRGSQLFPGFEPRYDLARINDSLWGMNLRLQPAIEEYLAVAFKLPLVTRLIARNTLFQILTGALPGLDSLIPLGKLWYELRRHRGSKPHWDRIVLDAPATGHALAMLRFPQTALDMVRSGNVADRTREIDAILRDRSLTALIAVTTLDELPVDETRELLGQVHAETPYRFEALICNQTLPDIGGIESDRYQRWLNGALDLELDALDAADESARERLRDLSERRGQQQARRSLLENCEVPVIETPWWPAVSEPERLTAMVEALDPA